MQPYLSHRFLLLSAKIVIQDLPEHLVQEDDQSQVVDILAVVLLDIDPVHLHEDVSVHHHGCLVVVTRGLEVGSLWSTERPYVDNLIL